jgi:hypothetical protein
VSCKSCQSNSRQTFNGEVAVHFPGLNGLDMPIVWVFPRLEVCLECGFAEFEIPEKELRALAQSPSTKGGLGSPTIKAAEKS